MRDTRPYHTRTPIIPERLSYQNAMASPATQAQEVTSNHGHTLLSNQNAYHTRTPNRPERLWLPPRFRPKRLLRFRDTRPYHSRTPIKPEHLSLSKTQAQELTSIPGNTLLSYQNACHTRTLIASPQFRPKRSLSFSDTRHYHTRTHIIPDHLSFSHNSGPRCYLSARGKLSTMVTAPMASRDTQLCKMS